MEQLQKGQWSKQFFSKHQPIFFLFSLIAHLSIFSQVSGRPAGNKLRFVSCGCRYTTTTLMFMVSITWAVLQNVENRHTGKFFNFKKIPQISQKFTTHILNFKDFLLSYCIFFQGKYTTTRYCNFQILFTRFFKCIFQNFGF